MTEAFKCDGCHLYLLSQGSAIKHQRECQRLKQTLGEDDLDGLEKVYVPLPDLLLKRVENVTRDDPRTANDDGNDDTDGDDGLEGAFLRCKFCPAHFPKNLKKALSKHVDDVHGENNSKNVMTCPFCGRMFVKRLTLQSHVKRHENAEAIEISFKLWSKSKWPDKNVQFHCKFCLLPVTSHETFVRHMKTQHPNHKEYHSTYTCEFCERPIKSELGSMKMYILHVRQAHPEEYFGKTLRYSSSLNPKLEGRPKAKCDECGKMVDVWYLPDHKRRLHSTSLSKDQAKEGNGEAENSARVNSFLKCPLKGCDAVIRHAGVYKNHFVQVHLTNNPFICEFPGCAKKFGNSGDFSMHKALHVQKPLTCDKCKVTYSRIDKLRNHVCTFNPKKLRMDKDGKLRTIYSYARMKRSHDDTDNDPKKLANPSDSAENKDNNEKTKQGENGNRKRKKRKAVPLKQIILGDSTYQRACKEIPDFETLVFQGNKLNKITPRKEPSWECAVCHKKFQLHRGLVTHQQTAHNMEEGATNKGTRRARRKVTKRKRKYEEDSESEEEEEPEEFEEDNETEESEEDKETEEDNETEAEEEDQPKGTNDWKAYMDEVGSIIKVEPEISLSLIGDDDGASMIFSDCASSTIIKREPLL